jgi:hypothetical protein
MLLNKISRSLTNFSLAPPHTLAPTGSTSKNLFFLGIILLVIDAIGKLLIYYFFKENNSICIIPDWLYLKKSIKTLHFSDAVIINNDLNSVSYSDISKSFISSFIYFILLIYFYLLKKWNSSNMLKSGLALLFYFLFRYLINYDIININGELIIKYKYFFTAIILINYILIPFLLLFLLKNFYSKLIIILLIVGCLGNVLSFMYPPYKLVDFIYIPSDYIYYNIADIYLIFKSFLIVISPIIILIFSIKKSITNNNE